MRRLLLSVVLCGLFPAAGVRGEDTLGSSLRLFRETGKVAFRHLGDQGRIPERYRLPEHEFPYELEPRGKLPGIDVELLTLRFPSPVESPHPENNTVHAEFYRPRTSGPFPAVIVLDITGGDQMVSRVISTHLANSGVGALFVQMAYYGPRRPAGSKLKLVTADVHHTMNAVRQTVLDLRRATAWLASRPEVDATRLGILGTSLGSFMGSLTAEMEPRLSHVAILLGGGGLADAYYDDPRAAFVRRLWELTGGTKAKFAALIAPADPITCAANLRDRKVLMIAASQDEIVPPKMAQAMWEAIGRQKIIWYDCTHYGAALYAIPALHHIARHFHGN